MLTSVLAFIVVLGVLIFVHELGHFLAAKFVGVAVPRFSIGFGPATPICFTWGETEYRLSWLPLGGYVKMASSEELKAMEAIEGESDFSKLRPDQFLENKTLAQRILVISAGVIMNVLLAWGVYTGLFAVNGKSVDPTVAIAGVQEDALPQGAEQLATLSPGTVIAKVDGEPVASWNEIMQRILTPTSPELVLTLEDLTLLHLDLETVSDRAAVAGSLIPNWPAKVESAIAGKPAAEAGLQAGDLIVAIDGQPIGSWSDLVSVVQDQPGQQMVFTFSRDGEQLEASLAPDAETVRVGDEERTVGRIGITPMLERKTVKYGLFAALGEGLRSTGQDAAQVFLTLKGMIVGTVSTKELGGPIMIGQVSGQVARLGFVALLQFMALLSVNLAVLNLLPIPVLDGGHLVFLFAEGILGRPVSAQWRYRATQAGFLFLLALMALVTVNDVMRIFG